MHYDKYLYKLVVYNQLGAFFRRELQTKGKLSYIRTILDELNTLYRPGMTSIPWTYSFWDSSISPTTLFDAMDMYRDLNKKTDDEYKIRCERNTLHIYSNDRKWLIKLANKLRQKQLMEFHEPSPETVSMLKQNENIIVTKKIPEYKYKVTLGKRKGNRGLANWIQANPTLAKAGEVALSEMYQEGYVKGYYFHVRDEKVLTMIQLMVGDNIQRIDKFVCSAT